jgi:ketosteroid isomerase-like protein
VKTEREFAATSLRKGIRASFMKYFADDGVSLNPKPHLYKESVAKSPPQANPLARTLYWEPVVADIASSGDLGYTMGPSSYRDSTKPGSEVQYGFFFSIWKKQKDGSWRVALDVGSGSSKVVEQYFGQSVTPAEHESYKGRGKTPDSKALRRELLTLDAAFARSAGRGDVRNAYRDVLDVHARALREGLAPLTGKDAILAYLVKGTAVRLPEPMDAFASKAGDLGYTYGAYRRDGKSKAPSGYYSRVWRRNGTGVWKLVFETASPAE